MPVSPRFNDISVIHYTISHLLEQVSVLEIYPRQTSRAGTKNAGIGIDYDHIGLVIGYLLGSVLVPVMITGTLGDAKISASPWIFIGSALFAYLTVLISSMKPAKIAGRVSPMEALRYTDGETVSKRKTKRSAENAGIPRMALANLGRNKKRTVTVICSLTLGLVLLSCVYGKNASFDIDKYMSQTVISDFEVEDF